MSKAFMLLYSKGVIHSFSWCTVESAVKLVKLYNHGILLGLQCMFVEIPHALNAVYGMDASNVI
jgi:hypothetical protein